MLSRDKEKDNAIKLLLFLLFLLHLPALKPGILPTAPQRYIAPLTSRPHLFFKQRSNYPLGKKQERVLAW